MSASSHLVLMTVPEALELRSHAHFQQWSKANRISICTCLASLGLHAEEEEEEEEPKSGPGPLTPLPWEEGVGWL